MRERGCNVYNDVIIVHAAAVENKAIAKYEWG